MKMYIAILDEFPDFMAPTLVAHTILNAHRAFEQESAYLQWFADSFKKVVVRVSQKEFDKIAALDNVFLGHENATLDGRKSCAVVMPIVGDLPNVIRFAKLWKPKLE